MKSRRPERNRNARTESAGRSQSDDQLEYSIGMTGHAPAANEGVFGSVLDWFVAEGSHEGAPVDERGSVHAVSAPRYADHVVNKNMDRKREVIGSAVADLEEDALPSGAIATRIGGVLGHAIGSRGVTIDESVPVEIVETVTHAATVKTSGREEPGAKDWFLVRGTWSDGEDFELWGTFGSFGSVSELSPEMQAGDAIPVNRRWPFWKQVVARTWNEKGGYIGSSRGAIPLAIAVAVLATESAGAATGARALPIILFEPHKFRRNTDGLSVNWGRENPEKYDLHFRAPDKHYLHEFNPSGSVEGGWRPFHGSQELEWEAFRLAERLSDRETAARCISIGAGQIIGFNAVQQGYIGASEMLDAMTESAEANVGGVFSFIRGNPAAEAAIASGDFFEFAALYNGRASAAAYEGYISDNVDYFHELSDAYLGGVR